MSTSMVRTWRTLSPRRRPERPDPGCSSPAPVSVARHAVMQGCALRPELCTVREFHQLPHGRRQRWVLTWVLHQHGLQRRRRPCEAAVRHAKAAMPILHQAKHRWHRSSLDRERRLRRLAHHDSVRRVHCHALMPNRLNEVDHWSDLRRVDRASVRDQELHTVRQKSPWRRSMANRVASTARTSSSGALQAEQFRPPHRVLDRQMIS